MEGSGVGDGGIIDANEDNMEMEISENRELLFNVWHHPPPPVQSDGVRSMGCGHFPLEEEHFVNNSSAKREADLLGLNRRGADRDFHKWVKVSHREDRHSAASSSYQLSFGDENVAEEPRSFMIVGVDSTDNVHERKPDVSDTEAITLDAQDSCYEDGGHRMDLTEDLLHMVFSFLDHKDICRTGATCKQWHLASTHEDFWRSLNFEDVNISLENFSAICKRYPNALKVNILGVPRLDALVITAMTSLRKLESLTLGKGLLPDGFLSTLPRCPLLKTLIISDAAFGSGVQELLIQHDNLQKLHIIKCRILRVSVRCQRLHNLSLKRSSMAQALLITPQLHILDISSCHKLSDAAIRSAATSCPLLTSLDMSFCGCVSDETLREVAFACPNLHQLDASFCPNISLDSVRLPMLTDLKLHNCEGITSVSVAAISHCYMLESLQLDCCALLTSVSLDLPHLQSISLIHCRKFVELNLRCPLLSSIRVSNCPVLHRINISSTELRKLVLQKQESLTALMLECRNLQEVDLTDCESLSNSICEVFNEGGGCPMLNSLILDNCESLTIVGFSSSSLISLSLVGCRAVTLLELSCPNLQRVNLAGCDHLESASFSPVGLWSLNLGICPKLTTLKIEAPQMRGLELKGCGVLSQASINCPNLSLLDASFCSQLIDESLATTAASCPLIETLILSSCTSIESAALSSLHWLGRLKILDLSYTFLTNLQPVFETCSQLDTLKLIACKCLTDSSLDAVFEDRALPMLRELDLSYSTAGKWAIEKILETCTNLVHVNLNGCINMHDLVWSTPVDNGLDHQIESLNCVGCRNIRRVVIPPSCRIYLTHLNVRMAANLKEVYVACPKLDYLNLSDCSSLETLTLDCPRLTVLYLTACTMLSEDAVEAAISDCEMLETLHVNNCPKIYPMYLRNLQRACPSLKRIYGMSWF